MVRFSGLTRKEAYSVLGKRGAVARRKNRIANSGRKKTPAVLPIPDDLRGVRRGDLVMETASKSVLRVLEEIDSKGFILCEDSAKHIESLHGSRLNLVAVSVDHDNNTVDYDALLDLIG